MMGVGAQRAAVSASSGELPCREAKAGPPIDSTKASPPSSAVSQDIEEIK